MTVGRCYAFHDDIIIILGGCRWLVSAHLMTIGRYCSFWWRYHLEAVILVSADLTTNWSLLLISWRSNLEADIDWSVIIWWGSVAIARLMVTLSLIGGRNIWRQIGRIAHLTTITRIRYVESGIGRCSFDYSRSLMLVWRRSYLEAVIVDWAVLTWWHLIVTAQLMTVSIGGCHWLASADLTTIGRCCSFCDDHRDWLWLVRARLVKIGRCCSFDDDIAWKLWSVILLMTIGRFCSFDDDNT